MLPAPGAPAVVIPASRSTAGTPVRADFTGDNRGPALADEDQPFAGEDVQGVLQGRYRNILQGAQLADGGERLARSQQTGPDRVSNSVRHLLP